MTGESPSIRKTGDLYELRFPEGVEIDASRVHDGREGMSAELEIRAPLQGHPNNHLHLARVNLLSTTARKTLAGVLADRADDMLIKWDRILEEAVLMIVKTARVGEPFIKLGQNGRPERRPFQIEGFLRQGEHTVLFGYKGTAKSLIALAFAYDVHAGTASLGRQVQQGPTMFLDWETDAETAEERLALLAAGRGDAAPPPVFYRRMTRPLVEDLTAVRRLHDREGVVLTVMDSQGFGIGTSGSKQDPAGPVLAFYAAAREIGGTTLGVDHRSHEDNNSKQASPYGSIYKANAARSLWVTKKSQEAGENSLDVGLFHVDANNYGRQRPFGFRIGFAEDAVTIRPEDARDVPLLREGLSAGERCYLSLTSPKSTADLADELELKPDTITKGCGRHPGIIQSGYEGKVAIWARLSDQSEPTA